MGRVTPGVQNSFDWRSEAQKEVPATVGAQEGAIFDPCGVVWCRAVTPLAPGVTTW